MKYEGEVDKQENCGDNVRITLTNVRRIRQSEYDPSHSDVAIRVSVGSAVNTFTIGRRVVVTVEAR